MTLSTKQQQFLDHARSGSNIFLTGKAGTGKSYIVQELIRELSATHKVVAVAPTGVAANNIGGQTIHSLFSLRPYGVLDFDACNYIKGDKRNVLKNIQVIVIDEVSMLRPDILDAMNWTFLKNGCGSLADRQVIFVGDLKQLPAPIDDNTRSVLFQTYDGEEFMFANIYQRLMVQTIELDEVLRQTDLEFLEHLNTIREGGKSEYFRQFATNKQDPASSSIVLAPHNSTVAMYNKAGLDAQAGEEFIFSAKISGNVKPVDFGLEPEIRVKNGCKIMYLVNSKDNPLINGTLGTFVSHKGCHFIRVNETDFALEPVSVTKHEYVYNKSKDKIELQEVGSIEQYPIKLAYALTIHKAQGLTFDDISVDLSRPCFQRGQLYVALSRVKTPGGLRIITNTVR